MENCLPTFFMATAFILRPYMLVKLTLVNPLNAVVQLSLSKTVPRYYKVKIKGVRLHNLDWILSIWGSLNKLRQRIYPQAVAF
jgi:hypothetical protein